MICLSDTSPKELCFVELMGSKYRVPNILLHIDTLEVFFRNSIGLQAIHHWIAYTRGHLLAKFNQNRSNRSRVTALGISTFIHFTSICLQIDTLEAFFRNSINLQAIHRWIANTRGHLLTKFNRNRSNRSRVTALGISTFIIFSRYVHFPINFVHL